MPMIGRTAPGESRSQNAAYAAKQPDLLQPALPASAGQLSATLSAMAFGARRGVVAWPAIEPTVENPLMRTREHSEIVADDDRSSAKARLVHHPAVSVGAGAVGAQAVGALVLAAFAVGALAIGALAIGRLAIGRARVRRLEIDELVVRRLHVIEQLQSTRER